MTRKELIKALRCFACEENCPADACNEKFPYWIENDKFNLDDWDAEISDEYQLCRAAADMLEQDAPGWISVKDRLPETSGYYLVCTYTAFYRTQCISKVFFDGKLWGSIRKRYANITHWMPLPEPPKEDEKS